MLKHLLRVGGGKPASWQGAGPQPDDPAAWADVLDRHLEENVLARWFPRCVDHEGGGFRQSYRRDWTEGSPEPKSLVFQARMTWVAATVARLRPDLDLPFQGYALHGLRFLRQALWDRECGGLFWSEDRPDQKHAYGISFGLLAAAAVHRSTGDSEALSLAMDIFSWLDTHAHDRAGRGYREALDREGTPWPSSREPGTCDLIGTPLGQRSSNTHLHLLEAFTECYRAWPDPLVRDRLKELLDMVRRILERNPGSLPRTFSEDWVPIDTTASYGHDLEVAYWLVEAANAAGEQEEAGSWTAARLLSEHALRYGFDHAHGGFFLEGPVGRPAEIREKVWWVQVEALCTLALLHFRFSAETSEYHRRFQETWSFVDRHMIDRRFGGWFGTVSENGRKRLDPRKGHAWKAAYHTVRALLTTSAAFGRLAWNQE